MDFGVQVQVLPVPPDWKDGESVRVNEKGFLLCPICQGKTKTKVIPGATKLVHFPLYCQWCKREIIVDYTK